MRVPSLLLIGLSLGLATVAASQTLSPLPKHAPLPTPTLTIATAGCANNPNAIGLARIVEVDTSGGPGFGFEHFKDLHFLCSKEFVLRFADGPVRGTPPAWR